MDDYKFEVFWNDPEPRLEKLSQYKGVLSPQFSAYYTMPVSLQIYNTFRSRWCGAYLQSKGFTVIPTVYWGQPQSYWYCFDGIEKNSVVALSTLGVKKEKDFFLQGYNEMLRRIEPKAVICYCDPLPEMKGHVIKVDYSKTNNLPHKKTFYGFVDNSCYKAGSTQLLEEPKEVNGHYVIKTGGYVITSGFGGGGGGSRTWGNREALPDHFDRHGNDFGAPNEENYAQQANRFFQERDRYQVKTDMDGIIRVYDPETNTFGSYNSDGTTRTFFKPRGGQKYFDNQPGE